MSLPRTVAEILEKHVTLEVESIDRMYLNVYVPQLQTERGAAAFFRFHRGHLFASTALMAPMTKSFVERIEQFAEQAGVSIVPFAKGQRKDDIAAKYRSEFRGNEGVLFVGKAQEKAGVFRSERRKNPQTGKTYAWIVRTTAMVNHYYFYCIDEDFGPFFLKFCSYFPYTAKLWRRRARPGGRQCGRRHGDRAPQQSIGGTTRVTQPRSFSLWPHRRRQSSAWLPIHSGQHSCGSVHDVPSGEQFTSASE